MRRTTALFVLRLAAAAAAPPHIITIIADDLGWANVGWHRAPNSTGREEVVTPHLDALVAEGIALEQFYAFKYCSPSRSALMSGRNPIHVNVVNPATTLHNPDDRVSGYAGIPLNMTTIAQKLRGAGYRAHAVGKWDLGHYARPYWPTSRGFSSYFGLLSTAYRSYTNHTVADWTAGCDDDATDSTCTEASRFEPVSLVRNYGPAIGYEGIYSTTLFGDEAASVLARHNTSENSEMPLFLYLAFNAPHAPVEIEEGFHATDTFKGLKANAKDPARRQFAGAL